MPMHNTMKRIAFLGMLAAGLALAPGCATSVVDAGDENSQVAQSVMDRLGQDLQMVHATCSDGVVTLRGVVQSEAQRARAIAVARSTSGVRDVVDQLRSY